MKIRGTDIKQGENFKFFVELKKILVIVLQGNKIITFGLIFSTGQQPFASLPEKLYKLTCTAQCLNLQLTVIAKSNTVILPG